MEKTPAPSWAIQLPFDFILPLLISQSPAKGKAVNLLSHSLILFHILLAFLAVSTSSRTSDGNSSCCHLLSASIDWPALFTAFNAYNAAPSPDFIGKPPGADGHNSNLSHAKQLVAPSTCCGQSKVYGQGREPTLRGDQPVRSGVRGARTLREAVLRPQGDGKPHQRSNSYTCLPTGPVPPL